MSSLTLDRTALGTRHVVTAVDAPASAPEWARWLEEIGFIPGEQVVLTARGALGGDPLVVRVGTSTFALRRAEAACVQVRPVGVAVGAGAATGAAVGAAVDAPARVEHGATA